MRRRTIACLFGLLPCFGGCSVVRQMEQNLSYEERLFRQDNKLHREMENDANELLREVCQRHPHKVFTADFREGFLDGYKDFMFYGGPIRPPAQPAIKYRNAFYLSAEGHAQVRQWFLGFQYGAECAQSTGRRQYYTLPVLVTDQPPLPPLNITVIPPPPEELPTDEQKKKETAPAPAPAKPEAPIPEPAKPEVPKASPPKADPPKADPPKAEAPKAMPASPPVQPAPKAEPAPKSPTSTTVPLPAPMPTMPVPVVPSVTPPPIPLIPMLPSVSLAQPTAAPALLPVSATIPVPNTP